MNNNRVSSYFRLPSLKLTELKSSLEPADKKYPAKLSQMNKAYLFGLEVEVEGVPNPPNELAYWKVTNDNSLRNNGVEFVSRPIRANQIEGAIQELTDHLPKGHEFSERTSCHVHMNVRDLTISEIYNVIVIYIAIEKVLFHWIGNHRDDNIFCVPLTETKYYKFLPNFEKNIRDIIHVWNKYTALNIIPIKDKGTIEFRHMYGTIDPTVLLTWINFLCCIKDTAKRWKTDNLKKYISQLNTNSEYSLFITEIFGPYGEILQGYNLQNLMEKSVSQLKLSFPNESVTIENLPVHDAPEEFNWTNDVAARPIIDTQLQAAAIQMRINQEQERLQIATGRTTAQVTPGTLRAYTSLFTTTTTNGT